jgi:hypothetical protein
MKKSFYLLILLISSFIYQSCEKDDSLDPRAQLISGQFVRLDITSKVLKSINPAPPSTDLTNFTQDEVDNSFFGGLLTNPSGNVVKYNLYIRRRDENGIISQYVPIRTITTFPHNLKITNADIAAAFNLNTSEIKYAEEYYFYGESFDGNGNKANFFSLSSTVQGAPGMKQGYRFSSSSLDIRFFRKPENLKQYDNYVFTP